MKRASRSLTNGGRGTCSTFSSERFPEARNRNLAGESRRQEREPGSREFLDQGSIGPGKRTARPTILPDRRSPSTSAASSIAALRATTGHRRHASAKAITRARSAIVEEDEPR